MAKTGSIIITLEESLPTDAWEQIEEIISQALFEMGYRGSIENNITGNTTTIQDLESAVEEDEY
jgi:hypothetical protein